MKKQKQLIKLLLLFLIFAMQSCFKEKESPCGAQKFNYYMIDTSAKNKLPYLKTTNDTLGFASDKGDTILYIKDRVDSNWYKKENYGNIECLPNYNFSEIKTIKYNILKGNDFFEIELAKENFISIVTPKINIQHSYSDILDIHFLNFRFIPGTSSINNKYNNRILPLMTLNNYTYYNVNPFYHNFTDSLSAICYYTSSDGIIKIEDKIKNKNWYIIRK